MASSKKVNSGNTAVVEIIPRSQFKDSESLDGNPSNSIQIEVIERTVDLRFSVGVSNFKVQDLPVIRSLFGLISTQEAQSLRSEINPNLENVCILDAKVIGTSCNFHNQDFRFGGSFTKNSLKFVEYVSPGALSEKIRDRLFDDKIPFYSVYIPASSSKDEISGFYNTQLLEFPEPVPMIQGSNSVWHDSIKMYAGVTMKSVENTVLKGKTTSITRSDSLIGFVIKSKSENTVFVADYKGEEETPVFPVDGDMVLKAPNFVFKNVMKTIGDNAQAMQKFAKTKLSAVEFYLLSDTLSHDYDHQENGALRHKTTGEVFLSGAEIELTVRLNLKLVYFHQKETSTAMWVESAPVWIKDIWPRKSVNLTTGRIDKGAKAFAGTVAYKDRLQAQKEKEQRMRKRTTDSSESSVDSQRDRFGDDIHDDDHDDRNSDKDLKSVDCFQYNASEPSSSSSCSSSSSSFYNPLTDDTL